MSKHRNCADWPQRRRHGSHRLKGFTLLEVLVATTLLATGIVGVLGVCSLSVRAASASQHLDDAVQLASSHLELAVALPGERLQPVSDSTERYAWTVTFIEQPEGLVRATVSVTWIEGGRPQTFRLSQVFKPGA